MKTPSFNGVHMGMGNIMKLSHAQTRSITAENVYGEKGRGGMAEVSATPQPEVVKLGQPWNGPTPSSRELGRGWKVRPCLTLPKTSTTKLMDIDGPGVIQHLWITAHQKHSRDLILRIYWDGDRRAHV